MPKAKTKTKEAETLEIFSCAVYDLQGMSTEIRTASYPIVAANPGNGWVVVELTPEWFDLFTPNGFRLLSGCISIEQAQEFWNLDLKLSGIRREAQVQVDSRYSSLGGYTLGGGANSYSVINPSGLAIIKGVTSIREAIILRRMSADTSTIHSSSIRRSMESK